jgi:thiamine pyrophosphokinase
LFGPTICLLTFCPRASEHNLPSAISNSQTKTPYSVRFSLNTVALCQAQPKYRKIMQDNENPATIATLLGAGPATIETAQTLARISAILVAADGGVAHAQHAGLVPDLILGDFDSLPTPFPPEFSHVRQHHMHDQDSTDFDKALRSVSADLFLCAGFLDGRTDHTLACFHSLLARPQQRAILVSESDAIMLLPARLEIALPPGTRVSVFPLKPGQARSSGLRWPLDDLLLEPGVIISTSNAAKGGLLVLEAEQPTLLLILPRCHLERLIASALQSAPWVGY